MKFAFVARYQPVWPTRMMCRLLGVSTSGVYEWLSRPQSARSLANVRLLARIRESFAMSQQTYGSPCVWKEMTVSVEPCSENRVARLMRVPHLSAQSKLRRKPPMSIQRAMRRADIFDYIEAFYNSRRRHSTLGQVSPNEFERSYAGLA